MNMAVAVFSPEGRLEAGLRELDCSGRNFVDIAKSLGARIAHGPFSEALNGKKPFDSDTAERLLEVLARMRDLDSEVGLPLDWSRTERISNALVVRLASKISTELGDASLEPFAERATKSVATGATHGND